MGVCGSLTIGAVARRFVSRAVVTGQGCDRWLMHSTRAEGDSSEKLMFSPAQSHSHSTSVLRTPVGSFIPRFALSLNSERNWGPWPRAYWYQGTLECPEIGTSQCHCLGVLIRCLGIWVTAATMRPVGNAETE